MNVVQAVAPTIEPISRAKLLLQIRQDSGSFDDNLTLSQSLAYGSHAIANNYTTHVGDGIDVLGHEAVVELHCGTNGATGTNDTRIEESDDDVTYTAWTGGAFDQVTTANDNLDYKIEYTGTKQYIRTASKVLLAACEFGTSILVNEATTAEDALLTGIIQTAREYVEDITRRALLTQTWYYYPDDWPNGNKLKLPFGNLQSTDLAVTYDEVDSDGNKDTTTMTLTTDYLIETNGEQCGFIVLPYGETWPSFTHWPLQPIKVSFKCGWTTAALLPWKIKAACLLIAADLYQNRAAQEMSAMAYQENKTVQRLLASARLWDEF